MLPNNLKSNKKFISLRETDSKRSNSSKNLDLRTSEERYFTLPHPKEPKLTISLNILKISSKESKSVFTIFSDLSKIKWFIYL